MRFYLTISTCLLTLTAVCQEEEPLTSVSVTCEEEKCVEQLCNKMRTYCVDNPYTKTEEEKNPISRKIELDQHLYTNFVSSQEKEEESEGSEKKKVQQITLADGSKWEVSQDFASMAKSWNAGDHISINIPHDRGGWYYPKHVYNLQNETVHQSLPALLKEADENQSKKIASLNPADQQICLSNGMCLTGPKSNFNWVFPLLKPGYPTLLGINTDLDSDEFPVLLIISIPHNLTSYWVALPAKLWEPVKKK